MPSYTRASWPLSLTSKINQMPTLNPSSELKHLTLQRNAQGLAFVDFHELHRKYELEGNPGWIRIRAGGNELLKKAVTIAASLDETNLTTSRDGTSCQIHSWIPALRTKRWRVMLQVASDERLADNSSTDDSTTIGGLRTFEDRVSRLDPYFQIGSVPCDMGGSTAGFSIPKSRTSAKTDTSTTKEIMDRKGANDVTAGPRTSFTGEKIICC